MHVYDVSYEVRNKLTTCCEFHPVSFNTVFWGFIRWFDKSIQFSAFGNGKVGTNVEHASVDATVSPCVTSCVFNTFLTLVL